MASLDVCEVGGDVLAVSRVDSDVVCFINSAGAELARVELPGGMADATARPTGYGSQLCRAGAILAVTAPYDCINSAQETGSVFLYRIVAQPFDVFVHEMLNTPEVVEYAHFGEHIGVCGDRLLVSAERIAGNAGRVSIFAI
jgi:hypothetical protein